MHNGEPCSSHSNSESATRMLERHIERQDSLEAALAESLKDLRQGFVEYRDAICAVLTAIREGVREMRDEVKDVHQEHETIVEELQRHAELLEREMREEVKNVHTGSETVNRTLERHIERQDALEAALAQSLNDLREGFGEYRQEHETIVEELQRHAKLLERVDTNARAVANGGLTAALEKALPAVLGALGVREQARCNMWQAIVVGGIGAAAGIIGTWLSLGK